MRHELSFVKIPTAGLRFNVFAIGTLSLIGLIAFPPTRRAVTKRLGDDIALPVFVALAAIQLSGLKVGLATASGLASLPLIGYWIVHRAMNPRSRSTFTPYGGILIALIVCTIWSSLGDGYFIMKTIAQVYLKIITAIMIVDLLDTREKIKKALMVCFLFLGINMVVSVIQQILSEGFGIHLSVAKTAMAFRGGHLASTGLGKSRNIFGQTSAVFVLIAIYLSISYYGRKYRPWMIPLILLSLTQIYMSYSRGAWAALVVGLILIPIVLRPSATPYVLPTYALGGLIVWFSGTGQRAVTGALELSNRSVDERFFLMQSGAHLFATNLWNGVGLDAFNRIDAAPGGVGVHNALFAAATDLGLPGLITYAAMMTWVLLHLVIAITKTTDPEFKVYLGGILIGVCALYVSLQVSALSYSYFVFLILAIAEAAAATALREQRTLRP